MLVTISISFAESNKVQVLKVRVGVGKVGLAGSKIKSAEVNCAAFFLSWSV